MKPEGGREGGWKRGGIYNEKVKVNARGEGEVGCMERNRNKGGIRWKKERNGV